MKLKKSRNPCLTTSFLLISAGLAFQCWIGIRICLYAKSTWVTIGFRHVIQSKPPFLIHSIECARISLSNSEGISLWIFCTETSTNKSIWHIIQTGIKSCIQIHRLSSISESIIYHVFSAAVVAAIRSDAFSMWLTSSIPMRLVLSHVLFDKW